MRKVPRSFKTPCYPVFQIVGIVLQVYMMCHISSDPVQRQHIYMLCFALFIGLFIYAFFWVKYKVKMPLLKGCGVHQVMVMESPAYHKIQKEMKKDKIKKGDVVKIS